MEQQIRLCPYLFQGLISFNSIPSKFFILRVTRFELMERQVEAICASAIDIGCPILSRYSAVLSFSGFIRFNERGGE